MANWENHPIRSTFWRGDILAILSRNLY